MVVLITDGMEDEGLLVLKEEGISYDLKKLKPDELLKEIGNYDALIVRSATKVTKDVLASGAEGRLKIVGRAGVGYDNVDVDSASAVGIVVAYAPHGNTNATAEMALALMLGIARNIPQSYYSLKNSVWVKKTYQGAELEGKKLGIIGCGRIGRKLARKAKHGMDMDVLGYDLVTNDEAAIKFVPFDYLISNSDFISIHAGGGKKPIIGKEELEKMKNTAYLINTSRGKNVDEEAVYNALKEKRIAGAAFDVFQKEGKEGEEFLNKLFELPNFIGTSHLGASTDEAQAKTGKEMASVIVKYLKYGEFMNAVNIGDEIVAEEKKPLNFVYIMHENAPGMFAKITGTFGKYNINIEEMPSRHIDGNKVYTAVGISSVAEESLLAELKSTEGICRVTY